MQDAEDSVMSTLILAYWCACVVHVGGPLPRPSVCVSVPADETLRQVLQRVVVSGGNRALHWRRDTDTPVVREMVSGTVLVTLEFCECRIESRHGWLRFFCVGSTGVTRGWFDLGSARLYRLADTGR